ncbi:hypothetical protein ACLB2K_025897 [Fragaria x ananassa]
MESWTLLFGFVYTIARFLLVYDVLYRLWRCGVSNYHVFGKIEDQGGFTMDIISQLQEQTNKIAAITFNTFGTLQRDSPAVKLSPDYPEPPANPTEDAANFAEQPKLMSEALVQAAKQVLYLSIFPIN